jgi:DNA-binding NtrC family response regulator
MAALHAYPWPGNVRELQNLVMTSVLFCDGPEVDVDDFQGFQAALSPPATASSPVPGPGSAFTSAPKAAAAPSTEDGGGDPATRLREALTREVAAAVASGDAGLIPLGKWLAEDLILAADRMAAGGVRRGAALTGLADTTYRRQLRDASARHASGVSPRSATWGSVTALLEDFIRARPRDTDVCQWAESRLLAVIEWAVAGDARKAAALLGVTKPTLLRRRAELLRQS